MQILLGLIPLALLGGGGQPAETVIDDQPPESLLDDADVSHWDKDVCIHRPGLQCTSIRATSKFDLHNDMYTSGAIFINVANYLREDISATPLDGDLYGASATLSLIHI